MLKTLKFIFLFLISLLVVSYALWSWQPVRSKIIATALKNYCQKQWGVAVSAANIQEQNDLWIIDNLQFSGLVQGAAERVILHCNWDLWNRQLDLDISLTNPQGILQTLPILNPATSSTSDLSTPRWELFKVNGKLEVSNGIVSFQESPKTAFRMLGNWQADGSAHWAVVLETPGIEENQCVVELISTKQARTFHIDMQNVNCAAAVAPLQWLGILKNWMFTEGQMHGHLIISQHSKDPTEVSGLIFAEQLTVLHPQSQLYAVIPALSLSFAEEPDIMATGVISQASIFGYQDSEKAKWSVSNINGELSISASGEANFALEASHKHHDTSIPMKIKGSSAPHNVWNVNLSTFDANGNEILAHLDTEQVNDNEYSIRAQFNQSGFIPLAADAMLVTESSGASLQGIISCLHATDPLRVPFGVTFAPIKESQQGGLMFLGYTLNNGWFQASEVPLNEYVGLFLLKKDWSLEGVGNLQGLFDQNSLVLFYDLSQAALENNIMVLQSDDMQSGVHYFDFIKKAHGGFLPFNNMVLIDKAHNLCITEMAGQAFIGPKRTELINLEAFHNSIYCAGDLSFDYSNPTTLNIDINATTLCGTIPQFQQLFSHFIDQESLPRCFLDGNISLRDQGAQLQLTMLPEKTLFQGKVAAALTDAALLKQGTSTSLRDLSLNLDIDLAGPEVLLSDIQGTLLIGSPERAEEYIVAGEKVHYLNEATEFDLWVGDRNRDILRLVGNTENDGKLTAFTLDHHLSHFGDVHPDAFQLVLKDWTDVQQIDLKFNFQLNTLLHDLQRFSRTGLLFLNRHLLEDLNRLKRAEGAFNVELHYDNQADLMTYDITGKDFAIGKHQFHNGQLNGKLRNNIWIIDQLQLDNLNLAAEFQRQTDLWKFKFLGIRAGKSLLLGLDGTLSPHNNSFDAKINLMEIQLAELGEWPTLQHIVSETKATGTMRAAGELHATWSSDKPEWCVNTDLHASLSECELLGSQIANTSNIPLQMVLKGDPGEFLLNTEIRYQGLPYWVSFQTKLPSFLNGELALRDHPKAAPLVIQWQREPNGFAIPLISGSISGVTAQLTGKSNQFSGEISVDLTQATSILPLELQQTSSQNGVGGYISFNGIWQTAPGTLLTFNSFNGHAKGSQCSYQGYRCKALGADLESDRQHILIRNLEMTEGAGTLSSKEVDISSDGEISIPKLVLENIRPAELVHKEGHENQASEFIIKKLELLEVKVPISDLTALTCTGEAYCENPPKANVPQRWFQMPQELLQKQGLDLSVLTPVSGKVLFSVADGRINLTKFKDVYSAEHLSKFQLAKEKSSYIDFAGNLHIYVRMKQYNLLFKLAELFTISVQGPWDHPTYSLLKDEG